MVGRQNARRGYVFPAEQFDGRNGSLPGLDRVAGLFAAQAIARRLIADGRENEVQEIRNFISTIVPDPDA